MTRKTDATDHAAIAAGASAPEAAEIFTSDEVAAAHKFTDSEGVVHTIREPERCIAYWPGGGRFTLDRGSRIEEEGRVPSEPTPEDVDDVDAALAEIEALKLGNLATHHNIQIVRVEQSGRGPLVAKALREAGFFVIPFNG